MYIYFTFSMLLKSTFMNIGCIITHENFTYAMYGLVSTLGLSDDIPAPRMLNYLPLAHMFGCGAIITITYLGLIDMLNIVKKYLSCICRWTCRFLAR